MFTLVDTSLSLFSFCSGICIFCLFVFVYITVKVSVCLDKRLHNICILQESTCVVGRQHASPQLKLTGEFAHFAGEKLEGMRVQL